MANQGRRMKRYMIAGTSVVNTLTSYSQSPVKKNHLRRRKRRKSRSSSFDRNSFPSASFLPGSLPFARANSQVGKRAPQLQSGTQCFRIRKRPSRKRNKRLRSGGSRATIWSRTRSNVSSWKVRLANPLHPCFLLNAANLAAEEKEAEIPDVDDTDGLDPEAEFEAWRLRELARIKRDKEAEVQRELEREEIERRRALPEEQRLKEDMENAKRTRDDKPKGQQKFLQKYWHKGAFHQVRHC